MHPFYTIQDYFYVVYVVFVHYLYHHHFDVVCNWEFNLVTFDVVNSFYPNIVSFSHISDYTNLTRTGNSFVY